jgi:sugar lactone lactonase YvrE
MKYSLLAVFFAIAIRGVAQDVYVAKDLTAEKLFTNNIEGPMTDKKGNLYVVNFEKDGTIGLVKPDGKCTKFIDLPQGSTANAIRFDSKGNMFLADFSGHNVLKVDMKTKQVSVFCHNEKFNQPNDIVIDKKDRIYASDPSWKNQTGQLWRIDTDGKAALLEANMGTTNGIELSPDGKTLYVNESIQRKIWAYQVDAEGNVSGKKLFAEFQDGGLDGMKCDGKGNLYVTRWGTGTVIVLSPEGKLLKEIKLKGQNVSNLTFNSKDKKQVFVTLQDRGCLETFRTE